MPLISAEQLSRELASDDPPLVIDVRPAEQFARGQIATAVHLDLWGVSLIDTSDAPLRAFMWMIGHLFALRGVDPSRSVVIYERESGIRAARAFWLLEYLDHPDVRVLDGGVTAWRGLGLPLETEPATPTPGAWHGTPHPDRLATWPQVLERLSDRRTVIVDTRSADEHTGRLVRAKRGGTIPGAVHIEWSENLSADGRFKTADELAELYSAHGVSAQRGVITFCQGGYRAAHTYLALRILGFPDVRNYTGSWKEWGDREDLPIAVTAEKQ